MLHNNVYTIKRSEVSKPSVKYCTICLFPFPILNAGLNTVGHCAGTVSSALRRIVTR